MITEIIRSVSDLYGKQMIAYGTGSVGTGIIPNLAQMPNVELIGVTNSRITEDDAGFFLNTNLPIRSLQAWLRWAPDVAVLLTIEACRYYEEVYSVCENAGVKKFLFLDWGMPDKLNVLQQEILKGLNIACGANEICDIHKETFSEFRSCHRGQTVAVVGAGPTLNCYSQLPQIPHIAHIGVNSVCLKENLQMDYYFLFHYTPEYLEVLKQGKFIKFFAQQTPYERAEIPEYFIEETNARRFFMGREGMMLHTNIEYYPLMHFHSIIFPAIHFALYTRPKKILLIGCDCADKSHFDGSGLYSKNFGVSSIAPAWQNGYKEVKKFAERYYPDTEIISVNPVGLKGMFHDVYTESYLDAHPEIERAGCEILNPGEISK